MTPIMLGIIGAEEFAESPHHSVMEAQPDRFQIAAVYDPSPAPGDMRMEWAGRSQAAALAAKYNSLRDLLSHQDLNAVLIAGGASSAPKPVRLEAAQAALDAGLHVVLERPMAASTVQCDQLIQRARSSKGATLTVAHLRRWDPHIEHALGRIDSGEIGDPLAVKLAGLLPSGGSLLFSDGIDLLDIAQMFNQSRLQEVSAAPNARGAADKVKLEALTALFRFEEPPCVEVSLLPSLKTTPSASAAERMPLPRLTVIGTKGSIMDSSPMDPPNAQPFYDGLWKTVRQRSAAPQGGKMMASSARNAVYLVERVLESARSGRAVQTERLLKAVE